MSTTGSSQPERKTQFDPREETAAPNRDVPMDVFLAAKDAVYGAMSYVDMEWTAHRPIQGDATPKVIAYWAAAAVMKVLEEKRPSEPDSSVPAPAGSGSSSKAWPADYSDYTQADYDLDQGPQS